MLSEYFYGVFVFGLDAHKLFSFQKPLPDTTLFRTYRKDITAPQACQRRRLRPGALIADCGIQPQSHRATEQKEKRGFLDDIFFSPALCLCGSVANRIPQSAINA